MKNIRRWGTLDPFLEHGNILGRTVANQGFITALLQQNPFDEYHFVLPNKQSIENTSAAFALRFPALANKGAFHFSLQHNLPTLLGSTHFSCFHLSDCLSHMVSLMQLRNNYAPFLFPITGVTHSLSYKRYLPALLEHIWKGVTPRDSIVTTSASAKAMLTTTFTRLIANYSLQNDAAHYPALSTIPLGATVAITQQTACVAQQLKEDLALGETTVFLCLARISAHSKMDIIPALTAFKEAEALGLPPQSYTVIIAGWVEQNDPLPEALIQYAATMNITLKIVRCPTDEQKDALYALADVFISPSDNIQETFGLTLVEAGMAGLPTIASHFDGYKDIIIDGETGFLVPTLGFATSAETNTLAALWFDNQYHLKLAQQTAISIPLFAKKIALLGTQPSTRTCMGKAAKLRAEQLFSWQTVINQYCDLWQTLYNAPITSQQEQHIRTANHPTQPNFAQSFAQHFTTTLTPQQQNSIMVTITPKGEALYRAKLPPLLYAGMEDMLNEQALHRLLFAARKPALAKMLVQAALSALQEQQSANIAAAVPPDFLEERAAFAVLWALKHHYVTVVLPN